MKRTRIPGLILILALGALSIVAVIVIDPLHPPTGTSSPGASEGSPSPRVSEPATGGLPELELGPLARGPRFDTTLRTGNPSGEGAQSKLWFHDGFWWGALVADGTDEFRIHRLDWAGHEWIDTGVKIATRASILPDVLAVGDQVWIATGGGEARDRRSASMFRYSYDPESVTYTLDADFPVTIAYEQATSLTLARDGQGRLWVAWINAGRLVVNRTDGNDVLWGDSYVPPVPGTDVATDAVTILPYGDTVALLWSNQNRDAVYLAIPTIDDTEHWEHYEVVVEGLSQADDHVSAVVEPTPDGPRLYAVVKTSLDALPNRNPDAPQVLLLVREPDGTWSQYLYGRVQDHHTRPVIQFDEENRVIYVIATSPFGGGEIYYKAASADDISFAPGRGTVLIQDPALPTVNSATGTKQRLSSATGLVVLASDEEAGEYAGVTALLEGDGAPDEVPPAVVPVEDRLMLDTFDPYPAGSPLAGRWAIRSTGATSFTIADVDGRRAATAVSTGDGSKVRMCKEIEAVADGVLRVATEVMLSRVGAGDATVTSIRHGSQESAVVRLSDRGTFSYFSGPDHVRSAVPYATGTWYRSTVTLDIAARTYDWEVVRLSDAAVVFRVADASWRSSTTEPATSVCLEAPESVNTGATFAVDRVRAWR
jgi:hypothetical protein